jgi:SNF2 family DNA or RNA helicase
MRSAWGVDAAKFTPQLTIAYADAGKDKYGESLRRKAFKTDSDIVVINTDGIKWIVDTNQAIRLVKDFDTLIVDEVTYYKHRTSQRSRAMVKLARRFPIRRGLSGTPRTNSVTDLWHQMYILDGGMRLGQSFTPFRDQVCTASYNGFGWEYEDKPTANDDVFALLRDVTIRHPFSVMPVPPNYTRHISFKLGSKHRKLYQEMERESLLEMRGKVVTAVNAAVLRTKLLQASSGAMYDEQGGYMLLDTSRYKLIIDLVAGRDHTIVFFNWRHQRDELIREATGRRSVTHAYIDGTVPHKKRAQIVEAFQAGDYQVLFLQPETGAHGLTLTQGQTVIFVSPQYKPDIHEQGIHRIYRGGQTLKTETILVEAEDTVEQIVYERLNHKSGKMLNLLDLIETTDTRRKGGI